MDKLIFNGVDVLNPIEGKLDTIIEYFVEYYGEEQRERITEKLNNTTFIFSPQNNGRSFNAGLYSVIRDKSEPFLQALDSEFGVNLVYDGGFRDSIDIIEYIVDNRDGEIVSTDELAFDIISRFADGLGIGGKKNYNEFSGEEISKIFDYMGQYVERYNSFYKSQVDEATRGVEEWKENAKTYFHDPDEVQKLYDEQAQIPIDCFEKLVKGAGATVRADDIEYYKNIYCSIFDSLEIPKVCTESYKSDIIDLLKFLGYNLGDDYQTYLDAWGDIGQLIIPEDAYIDYSNYEIKINDYIESNNKPFCWAMEIINGLDIKYDTDRNNIISSLRNFAFNSHGTNGLAISYLDSQDQLKNVVICRDYLSMSTETLIHEMNHVIESSYIGEDELFYFVKCGWDILPMPKQFSIRTNENYEQTFMNKGHRKYETASEIVNQDITLRIASLLDRDGFEVGLAEESCLYELGFDIFRKFMDENWEVIKNSRLSANAMEIARYISPETFAYMACCAEDYLYTHSVDYIGARNEIQQRSNASKTSLENELIGGASSVANSVLEQGGWSENAERYLYYLRAMNKISEELSVSVSRARENCDETEKN